MDAIVITWRIYYSDREVDNTQADPYEVPGLDVQAIVQSDPDVGRYVLHHMDYYWWVPADQQWHQGDHFGLWDYLQRPGAKKVIFGRSLDNIAYKKVLTRAVHDPDFVPMSSEMPL
jgi:hypothetical protein